MLLLGASWATATNTLTFNDGSGTPDATSIALGGSFSFDITFNVGNPPADAARSQTSLVEESEDRGVCFGASNWLAGEQESRDRDDTEPVNNRIKRVGLQSPKN